jgi:hypothetical protein
MGALNIIHNKGGTHITYNMGALNIIHNKGAHTMHKLGALTFTFCPDHGMAVKMMLTTSYAEFY